jgi:tape measure domain-containing protein
MAEIKDNILEINRVYQELNKTIQKNIDKLEQGARSLQTYNQALNITPSGFNRALLEMNRTMQRLTASLQSLQTAQGNVSSAERENAMTREALNREQISAINLAERQRRASEQQARDTERQTRANERLNSAYQQLSRQEQESARRVQDLITRGRTATQTTREYSRELQNAQREHRELQRRVLEADRAVGRFQRNVGNYQSAFRGLGNLMGAFGVVGGVSLFAGLVQDIYKTTKELQSLDMALKNVLGSTEAQAETMLFLRDIAEKYGIEINGLQKQYTQFFVSAKDKMANSDINAIFESIAKAGASMGLSLDAQNRAFVALNQMMSKGKVTAEELRGQLGEALPGAFVIMAKSMGVTTAELDKMLKLGQVNTDVLVGFAKQLEKTYGIENVDRIETMASASARLSNAWTEFVRVIGGGNNELSKFLVSGLTNVANFVTKTAQFIQQLKFEWTDLLNPVNAFFSKIEKFAKNYDNRRVANVQGAKDEFNEVVMGKQNKLINEKVKLETELSKWQKLSSEYAKNQVLILEKKIKLKNTEIEKSKEQSKEESKYMQSLAIERNVKNVKDREKAVEKILILEKEIADFKKKNGEIGMLSPTSTKKRYQVLIDELNKWKKVNTDVNLSIAENNEKIKLTKEILEQKTKVVKENNNAQIQTNKTEKESNTLKKESNTLKKEEREIVEGSVEYYEKLIAQLKEQQQQQATTNAEYNGYNLVIDGMVKKLESLIGKKKELANVESDPMTSISISDEDLMNDMYNVEEEFFNFAERMKAKGIDLMSNFAQNTGFTTTFQILNKQIEGFGTNWLITTDAILTASTEMFNFLNQMGEENFQAEYDRENRRKETALMFAGDSAEARAEIERESERRTKEIRRREAQNQKKQAIFQASIDMVKGVMGAIAANPVTLGMPQAAIIGALGLANIARINSQQIPEFWKGTDNAPEGLAWTNERGREIITDAKGKIKDFGTDKGATLKYLNKGDKVLKHSDTMRELDNILMQNNINKPLNNNINIDLLPLQKDIKELTNIMANKSEFTIIKDMQGERYYKRVNGQRQELKNTILNLKTRNV